jgi:HEAT repeat protein
LVSADLHYNQAHFAVKPGISCLLLLKQTGDGWAPVDETLPFIPLGADAKLVDSKTKDDPKEAIVELMAASMDDPTFRRALTYLLRDVTGRTVMNAVAKYKEDNDPRTASAVLSCLAFNQDTTVIPLIVAMEKNHLDADFCASSLGKYRNPDAIPLLNAALDDGGHYTRLNAISALNRIGDYTSIPYLMRAMLQDDPGQSVSWEAYVAVHRILGPTAGPHLGPAAFQAHRDAEIETLQNWLRDHADALDAPHDPGF